MPRHQAYAKDLPKLSNQQQGVSAKLYKDSGLRNCLLASDDVAKEDDLYSLVEDQLDPNKPRP